MSKYDCTICDDMGIAKTHWAGCAWIYPASALVPCYCMKVKQDPKITEGGRMAYLKIMNRYMKKP